MTHRRRRRFSGGPSRLDEGASDPRPESSAPLECPSCHSLPRHALPPSSGIMSSPLSLAPSSSAHLTPYSLSLAPPTP
eukprot:7450959-Pyramimonas_sp.AAC.1